MLSDEEKRLIYFKSEEHLVRRLGAAVVSCWRDLPQDLRTKLLSRAENVLDKDQSSHVEAEMKHFIAAST